jgi:hypothetical protein
MPPPPSTAARATRAVPPRIVDDLRRAREWQRRTESGEATGREAVGRVAARTAVTPAKAGVQSSGFPHSQR